MEETEEETEEMHPHVLQSYLAWQTEVKSYLGPLFDTDEEIKEFMISVKFDWVSAFLNKMTPEQASSLVVV